jgi:plastocyanin
MTTTSPSTENPSQLSTATTASNNATSGGQSFTIDLTAQNTSFDKSTISVPAGSNVTVNFNNKDSGMAHNFSVYQTLNGGQTKPIFIGNTIVGPSKATYRFTAPSVAGTYFFECDVHPSVMNGTFVVTGQ